MENDNFTQKFKYYLAQTGFTQQKLAKAIDFDKSTVSKWVSTKIKISAFDLRKCCETLHLTIDQREELFRLAGLAPLPPKENEVGERAMLELKKHFQEQRLPDPEHFRWISKFRREMYRLLDHAELAFALRCSLQHGMNVPFWAKANAENPAAPAVILEPIIQNHGRRPMLRAGFALEMLTDSLKRKPEFLEFKSLADVRQKVVESALTGKTIDLWKNELVYQPRFEEVLDSLLIEMSESAD